MFASKKKKKRKSLSVAVKKVFLGIYHFCKKRWIHGPLNYNLLFILLFLNIFGIIMIYSASYYVAGNMSNKVSHSFFVQQLVFSTGGFAVMLLTAKIDYHVWLRHKWTVWFWYFWGLGVTALLLTPLGSERLGARRWLNFGIITLQAAEPVKLFLLMFLATFVSSYGTGEKAVFAGNKNEDGNFIEEVSDSDSGKEGLKKWWDEISGKLGAGCGILLTVLWKERKKVSAVIPLLILLTVIVGLFVPFPVSKVKKWILLIFVDFVVIGILLGKYSVQFIKWCWSNMFIRVWICASFLCVFLGGISNNMSTATIMLGICFIVMWVCRKEWRGNLAVVMIGIVTVVLLLLAIRFVIPASENENFRITRIRAYFDPIAYIAEEGQQGTQALYAIASGGFWGKGLGQSLVKFRLSEPYNDYIVAIVGEELGLFGILLLLFLFGFLLRELVRIIRLAPDIEGKVFCLGVFAHIALQVALNVCVATGLFPTTGVTLPFISYGGSSVLFTLIEFGIVLSIDSYSKNKKYRYEAIKLIKEKEEAKRKESLWQ